MSDDVLLRPNGNICPGTFALRATVSPACERCSIPVSRNVPASKSMMFAPERDTLLLCARRESGGVRGVPNLIAHLSVSM